MKYAWKEKVKEHVQSAEYLVTWYKLVIHCTGVTNYSWPARLLDPTSPLAQVIHGSKVVAICWNTDCHGWR